MNEPQASPHTSLHAAYIAAFQNPQTIQSIPADAFTDEEYAQLVMRVAKIDVSALKCANFDRIDNLEERLEQFQDIRLDYVPFENAHGIPYVSEEFYMRIARRLCRIPHTWPRISTALPMDKYTELVNIAVRVDPHAFGQYEAHLIEPATYKELAKIVAERASDLIGHIEPDLVDDYDELVRIAIQRYPQAVTKSRRPVDRETLIDCIKRDFFTIYDLDESAQREYARIAIESNPKVMAVLPADVMTAEEYTALIKANPTLRITDADHLLDGAYEEIMLQRIKLGAADDMTKIDPHRFDVEKHKEAILKALSKTPEILHRFDEVDSRHYTAFARAALMSRSDAAAYVKWANILPERQYELWKLAVEYNPLNIAHLASFFRTNKTSFDGMEEIFRIAVEADHNMWRYVPSKVLDTGPRPSRELIIKVAVEACKRSPVNLTVVDSMPSDLYEQCARDAVMANIINIRFVKCPPCREKAYESLLELLDKAAAKRPLSELLRT